MVICSINQFVLSSGEGLGGLEGPMPWGGSSLCGGFGGSSCGLGCGGLVGFGFMLRFHWGAIVGGWGLGGLGFARVIIP